MKRSFWIDMVKCVAIVMVILSYVLWAVTQIAGMRSAVSSEFLFCNSIFAGLGVPLFMMVSGSLLFGKTFQTKGDIILFYKRNLLPLILTAEIWIVVYCLVTLRPFSLKELILCMTLFHKPEVHLWYVRLIVIYYLAVPFINRFRNENKYIFGITLLFITTFTFLYNGWLIWAGDLCPTTPSRSYFCYLVYMAIGYWISRTNISQIKACVACIGMGAGGILLFHSLLEDKYFLWYDNPLLALMAIGLFYLLRQLFSSSSGVEKVCFCVSNISKMSYGIYLSHFLLIYIIGMLVKRLGCDEVVVYVSLLMALLVDIAAIQIVKRISPGISKYIFRY